MKKKDSNIQKIVDQLLEKKLIKPDDGVFVFFILKNKKPTKQQKAKFAKIANEAVINYICNNFPNQYLKKLIKNIN